jgi:tetratricopeptide (TPR) repeat protein
VTTEARGVLAEAKAAALQIKNDYQRELVLDEIGAAEIKAGDLNAAVETAVLAYPYNTATLTGIGERLGDSDAPDRARAVILKLKGDGASTVYAFMSRRQAAKGNIAGALQTTEFIQAPEVRRDALQWVAEQQALEGNYDGARKTIALARASYPAGRSEPDEETLMIVRSQLSRGETQAARATIATLKSARTRAAALLVGAEEFRRHGDTREAAAWLEEALKGMQAGPEYDFFNYFSIPLQVKLGRKEDVMLAAGSLSGDMRSKVYAAVAVACAEVDDVACVNTAVAKLSFSVKSGGEDEDLSRFETHLMILNITAALIDNDQSDAASRLLNDIERHLDNTYSKMSVGPEVQLQRTVIQALMGNFEEARLLAMKMPTDSAADVRRGTALRMLALLHAKKSGPTLPQQWAIGLGDPVGRAYALLGIAQAQLGIGGSKLSYSAIQIH